MNGTLGYLRGATKCLLCSREHEPTSVSFGVAGSISICPGHPMKRKRTIPTPTKADRMVPPKVAGETIGPAQGEVRV